MCNGSLPGRVYTVLIATIQSANMSVNIGPPTSAGLITDHQGPFLLTWINFNLIMDR